VEVVDIAEFRTPQDLTKLLPLDLPQPFDTAQLAKAMDTKRWIAQKVTYCLRHMKAIKDVGKTGIAILYRLPSKRRKRVA
jgi:hypothetical protein